MCFFGNAQPKSNARAHLKQRKKHSGLNIGNERVFNPLTTGAAYIRVFIFY